MANYPKSRDDLLNALEKMVKAEGYTIEWTDKEEGEYELTDPDGNIVSGDKKMKRIIESAINGALKLTVKRIEEDFEEAGRSVQKLRNWASRNLRGRGGDENEKGGR